MLRRCDDTGLIDQRSQRIALAALVYSEHGKASRSQNPCAHGNPHVGGCTSMHLCLDHALLRLSAQQPLKGRLSPKPVYFDDVDACGDLDTGLGLQVKQSVFQWSYDNKNTARHKQGWWVNVRTVLARWP
jgi:hypothetical protein